MNSKTKQNQSYSMNQPLDMVDPDGNYDTPGRQQTDHLLLDEPPILSSGRYLSLEERMNERRLHANRLQESRDEIF